MVRRVQSMFLAVSETRSICAAPTCQKQFKESAAFGALFRGEQFLVFLGRHTATLLVTHLRPLARGQDRQRQPASVSAKKCKRLRKTCVATVPDSSTSSRCSARVPSNGNALREASAGWRMAA